jgi:hypothetical protein
MTRRLVVTGGGTGIGRACARRFVQDGPPWSWSGAGSTSTSRPATRSGQVLQVNGGAVLGHG